MRSLLEMDTSGDWVRWRRHWNTHMPQAPLMATMMGYTCSHVVRLSHARRGQGAGAPPKQASAAHLWAEPSGAPRARCGCGHHVCVVTRPGEERQSGSATPVASRHVTWLEGAVFFASLRRAGRSAASGDTCPAGRAGRTAVAGERRVRWRGLSGPVLAITRLRGEQRDHVAVQQELCLAALEVHLGAPVAADQGLGARLDAVHPLAHSHHLASEEPRAPGRGAGRQ